MRTKYTLVSLWAKDKLGRIRNYYSQVIISMIFDMTFNLLFLSARWWAFHTPEEGGKYTHNVSSLLALGLIVIYPYSSSIQQIIQ